MLSTQIQNAIKEHKFPEDINIILSDIKESDNKYISQEGYNWDFKYEWPFSYSDKYFYGICRLIVAFANTHGGLIVFGVHDTDRTPGHNKVKPNVDKLQLSLKNLIGDDVDIIFRRHLTNTPDAVDLLLVLPRKQSVMPFRFLKTVEGYKENLIWIRSGHEVIQADPRHTSTLYCRDGAVELEDNSQLGGGLPPNYAFVKRFVGRMATIDQVFQWLICSDEPRKFLYGKGGSGKTTIAYEVARILKNYGANFRLFDQKTLDNVIFVSAKHKTLDAVNNSQIDFIGKEFGNARELYLALLNKGNWSNQSLNDLSTEKIISELQEYLDITSNFIVIDDVDTLTTQGVDAGIDTLYKLLLRAKCQSRILYTLRNVPTHSLVNAIEVPGLPDGDYEEFIKTCCGQLKVQKPSNELVQGKLAKTSERRPLILQSIISLRKTSGDYNRALQLFEQHGGDDIRSYVFQREWDALPEDNYARTVLTIIAIHSGSLTFSELLSLTRYEDERVRDALSEVREMFLEVNDIGNETTYTMGSFTASFVRSEATKLDQYSTIKARVDQYKRKIHPDNPLLRRLIDKVEMLLWRGKNDPSYLDFAWSNIVDPSIPPQIREDPRFLSFQGYVCTKLSKPKLEDGRQFFRNSIAMKYEPDFDYIKSWFFAEKDSGIGIDNCLWIADFVWGGKQYTEIDKLYLRSRKATCLYSRGMDERYSNPERAAKELHEALQINLLCYKKYGIISSSDTETCEKFSRNTAYAYFSYLLASQAEDHFFNALHDFFMSKDFVLDPIEDPLVHAYGMLSKRTMNNSTRQKIKNKIISSIKDVQSSNWYSQPSKSRVVSVMKNVMSTL